MPRSLPNDFLEFNRIFPTEKAAVDYFLRVRYGDTLICPRYGAKMKVYRRRKRAKVCHCKNRNNSFSPFSGMGNADTAKGVHTNGIENFWSLLKRGWVGTYRRWEEKLDKVCKDFTSLSGDKQDYVLGILQTLIFAKDEMGTGQPVEADKNNVEGAFL
jgi:hypothetical protein